MKKFLPLVALLTTVAFSVPVIAAPHDDAEHTKAEAHAKKDAAHKEKKAKGHHHKGHKAAAKKGPHGEKKMKPCHKGYAPSMEAIPAPKETTQAPSKVWMPSMTHGFHK